MSWVLCLLAVFVIIFGAGVTAPEQNALRSQLQMAGVSGCVLFGAFVWYLYGLIRQELLR